MREDEGFRPPHQVEVSFVGGEPDVDFFDALADADFSLFAEAGKGGASIPDVHLLSSQHPLLREGLLHVQRRTALCLDPSMQFPDIALGDQ